MLKNELHILQSLCEFFGGEGTANAEGDAQEPHQLKCRIDAECSRVKAAFTDALFSAEHDHVIERYIRHHQCGITELANRLYAWLTTDAWHQSQEALSYFIERLSGLLLYIRKFFDRYFDVQAAMPAMLRGQALGELAGRATILQAAVETRVRPAELAHCVTSYLRHIAGGPEGLSYGELDYFELFVHELTALFAENGNDAPKEDLCLKLIQLNFNQLDFFLYRQEAIRKEVEHAVTPRDELNLLQHYLKVTRGAPARQTISFDASWPDIKTMLCGWLEEEVTAFETAAERGTGVSYIREEAGKLSFNHSVAQIACLIHALYDENCFGGASISDVLRFAVRHFRSKRQQQISLGSLSKEYYSVSQVNAAVIRDLCQRMTARINRHYFPAWLAIGAIGCAFGLK